jgi:hypothetical protein
MHLLLLARAALRLRPISFSCMALLLAASASVLGTSAPLAVLVWAVASLLSLKVCHALEPFVLRRLGCRAPDHLEWERLDPALHCANVDVVVVDAAEPWLGRGLRTVLISRALLDLLEDRALGGLLTHATQPVRSASLAGEIVVRLGNLPLLSAWWLSRSLAHLGRLLAVVMGAALVVPFLLWPNGFARWAGQLFGAAIVGLSGAALLSSGFAAPGLGLLLAWAIVPGLSALLAWETRRAEMVADDATLDAGQGWQLLEALETLIWAQSLPPPAGLLGLLCRARAPLTGRADRLWLALSQASEQKGGPTKQP